MKVPFIDLPALHRPIEQKLIDALTEVLRSGRYILGPKVEELEEVIAEDVGVRFAVGVSSGTDALLAALMALDVRPGDKVVTTPFSFVSTGEVIARTGARPVFVDLEADGYNMDPDGVADVLDEDVKAIIPVHLYGRMANVGRLREVAEDIPIIEDSAQSLGASCRGKAAGSMGDLGCFSFFPTKNLGCLGDGGMVTTDSEELDRKLRMIRAHGGKSKSSHPIMGGNFRLDPLQAAVLLVKRPHLEAWTKARRENARAYDEAFRARELPLGLPALDGEDEACVWNQYVINTPRRDELKAYLAEEGIATAIYYEKPFHLEGVFSYLRHKAGDFPRAEKAARQVLALPVHPTLSTDERQRVVEGIANFFRDK